MSDAKRLDMRCKYGWKRIEIVGLLWVGGYPQIRKPIRTVHHADAAAGGVVRVGVITNPTKIDVGHNLRRRTRRPSLPWIGEPLYSPVCRATNCVCHEALM